MSNRLARLADARSAGAAGLQSYVAIDDESTGICRYAGQRACRDSILLLDECDKVASSLIGVIAQRRAHACRRRSAACRGGRDRRACHYLRCSEDACP